MKVYNTVQKTKIIMINEKAAEIYNSSKVIHLEQDDSEEEEDAKREEEIASPAGKRNWSLNDDLDYDSDEDKDDLMETTCELTKKELKKFKLIGKLGTLLISLILQFC